MFRTISGHLSSWESLLPPELLRLPEELTRVDALLDDPAFFAPFAPHFHPVLRRPSTPIECYLLKFRYRLGYESLCAEVSDSISWRRFCRIGLDGRVPHPTTLMKLTTRCGEAAVAGLNEALWAKAAGQKFPRSRRALPRPARPARGWRSCIPSSRLTCPSVRTTRSASAFKGSPAHVSPVSGPATRAGIRPVIPRAPGGGAGNTALGFLPPFGHRHPLLGHPVPAREFRPPYGRPTRQRLDPGGVSTFRTSESRPEWAPSLPRGSAVLTRPVLLCVPRISSVAVTSSVALLAVRP